MSNHDEQAFSLLVAEQQRASAETLAREQVIALDRVRSRLVSLLPLTVTLTTASLAVAFSNKPYSYIGAALSVGFLISGILCLYGLRTETGWRNIHIHPVDIAFFADKIKSDNKKEDMNTLLALYVTECNDQNSLLLQKNRKRLQRVLWSLGATVSLSPVIALIVTSFER